MKKALYFDVEWANPQNKSICQIGMILEDLETRKEILPKKKIYINPDDKFDDASACSNLFFSLIEKYEIDYNNYISQYIPNHQKEFIPYVSYLEFSREINKLYGVISGILIDNEINEKEKDFLIKWRNDHKDYKYNTSANFVIKTLDIILDDGIITINELETLKSEIIKFLQTVNSSKETLAMQYLQGMIKGITSDKVIHDIEIYELQKWLYENDYLAGQYPYDRIIKLINIILKDNIITDEEKIELTNLFDEVFNPLSQIKDQVIEFENRTFCLSGNFNKGSKSDIEKHIILKGGKIDKGVKKTTNYVVVGEFGSERYSNESYGTKVKKAMELNITVLKESQIF